ncbi:hypothetical protein [Vacuolonema iberomarrocanum]|uniref:hypothetical protein n=1 Tax=Vacuolonema iberomarrocanum TaxID=3454632 RepID=UPI0019E2DDDC|nr:hypothetical protein [filamentous cyanobacterium LEGE 07170]
MSTGGNTLPNASVDEHRLLKQQIHLSLQKAEAQKSRLKSTDRRYTIMNLVLGAIATFIAGESAIAGEPILGSWRFTATLASVCTLSATIVAGVHKQVASPDLLLEASECAAKLKALKIETIPETYELEPVSDAY